MLKLAKLTQRNDRQMQQQEVLQQQKKQTVCQRLRENAAILSNTARALWVISYLALHLLQFLSVNKNNAYDTIPKKEEDRIKSNNHKIFFNI